MNFLSSTYGMGAGGVASFPYPQIPIYGFGANSVANIYSPQSTAPQNTFQKQPVFPEPQMQNVPISTPIDFGRLIGGDKNQAGKLQDEIKSMAIKGIGSLGTAMGLPPGFGEAMSAHIANAESNKSRPQGLLSADAPQAPQLAQMASPQQVSNGATQYLQMLQGLLV